MDIGHRPKKKHPSSIVTARRKLVINFHITDLVDMQQIKVSKDCLMLHTISKCN